MGAISAIKTYFVDAASVDPADVAKALPGCDVVEVGAIEALAARGVPPAACALVAGAGSARLDEAVALGWLAVSVGGWGSRQGVVALKELSGLTPFAALPATHPLDRLMAFDSLDALVSAVLAPKREAIAGLKRVYLFGAQRLGPRALAYLTAAGIEVLGFIDNDKRKHGTLVGGKPVMGPEALDPADDAWVIVTSAYGLDITRQLAALGIRNVLLYHFLPIAMPERYQPELQYDGLLEDLFSNRHKLLALHANLADDTSREHLAALLAYRISLDPVHLDFPDDNEYFEPGIVELGEREVFVDGGGFTGDTALRFIQAVGGKYGHIHLFEPDLTLMARARHNLAPHPEVSFHELGLYAKRGTVRFQPEGDMTGAIVEEGGIAIPVADLDSEVTGVVSFLKLDIEGAEEPAMLGALGHFAASAPTLAIAAYHRAQDLWRLPELACGAQPGYRVYLRHYTRLMSSSVFYAAAARSLRKV